MPTCKGDLAIALSRPPLRKHSDAALAQISGDFLELQGHRALLENTFKRGYSRVMADHQGTKM